MKAMNMVHTPTNRNSIAKKVTKGQQKYTWNKQKKSGKNTPFKCVGCAQLFEVKAILLRHRITAHGKSKLKCRNRANKSFKWGENYREKYLYEHTDNVPNIRTNQMECNNYEEKFRYLSKFLKHRKASRYCTWMQISWKR